MKNKKRGRPKLPKGKIKKTRPIRIGDRTFNRLLKLKKKKTFDELMDELLLARELIAYAKKCFLVGNTLYDDIDLTEARGKAITYAVRTQRMPVPPQILLNLGNDDGK